MLRSQKLQPVVNLAHRNTDEAGLALARVNQRLQHQQQQLIDLQQYRQDYLQRFRQGDLQVMSARKALDLRHFLAQLDQTILLQEAQVKQAQYQVELQQKIWQQARAKAMAMDTLVVRYQQEEATKQSRQEQRNSDQYTAQMWQRKHTVKSGNTR